MKAIGPKLVIATHNAGKLREIQGTAEAAPFSEAGFSTLLSLAKKGVSELVALQRAAFS